MARDDERASGATGGAMKRRGILAAAGAVVAGIVAKQASQSVGATSGAGTDMAVIMGSNPANTANTARSPTWIVAAQNFTLPASTGRALMTLDAVDSGTIADVDGVSGLGHNNGNGVTGTGGVRGGSGVIGTAGAAYFDPFENFVAGDGLIGYGGTGGIGTANTLAGGSGAFGRGGDAASGGQGGDGLTGYGGGGGGTGQQGYGVQGQAGAGGAAGAGVYGINGYGLAGGAGVLGESFQAGTYGVKGISTNGIGVYGTSTGNYGVLGISSHVGSAGLTGITTTTNVPAFAGGSTTPSARAAQFNGGVYIDCTTVAGGQFVVNPMTAKSGLLKHPDGSYRLMYSVEAPESWAEDVGTGTLTNGKAEVKLDPDFAAVIETGDYHVFLTMYDTPQALCVTNRMAGGFTVQAEKAGASGAFSWRVMATPKTEKKVARLAKYDLPAPLHLPTADELPKAADVPVPPRVPSPLPSPAPPVAAPSPVAPPASASSTVPPAPNPLPQSRP